MSWTKTGAKLTVGNVELLDLCDCVVDIPIPLSQLFPDATPQTWAPYQERFPEAFAGPDTWRAHMGGYLLRSEGRTILVDTGLGSRAMNRVAVDFFNGGRDGRMLAELESAGVRPEDVDTVVITHLHRDHVGWNFTMGRDGPVVTFPKARYVVHQADWDFFSSPEAQEGDPGVYWKDAIAPLETLGSLDLISGDGVITGEVTTVHTPGHTPGHMCIVIASGGERALITGDMVVVPPQVTEVDWKFQGDHDHDLAARTRRRVLDKLEAEGSMVIGCHFPAPGYGKMVRIEGRRYWQGL